MDFIKGKKSIRQQGNGYNYKRAEQAANTSDISK